MLHQLGQELLGAHNCILDHRAFVDGEINNFVNEFELKRNEVEVETLFKVTETVGDLKYDLSERCTTLCTTHLGELDKEVNKVLQGLENFLSKNQLQRKPNEFILNSRAERGRKRKDFDENLEHKFERIKNSFQEKEEEIDELYSDLQLKLNIQK